MVDNHEENTIQNQLKLFPVYNNQECFFKSPWASISVNSPNRTIHLANDSFSCTSCNPCFTRGILTGFKCSPHIFICVCVSVCLCVCVRVCVYLHVQKCNVLMLKWYFLMVNMLRGTFALDLQTFLITMHSVTLVEVKWIAGCVIEHTHTHTSCVVLRAPGHHTLYCSHHCSCSSTSHSWPYTNWDHLSAQLVHVGSST